ncbi:uncharacterized protein BX664DRAFT_368747 [Halteromyces radiatus]|uniref:uncharacterized protein n=1 Tax=Halteromyces radiatus TaxID=101107 RepID=UPI002220E16E|nr:uncharacterized protein BX664DRAFT_368747 [Halteromyces radiatus]KAI8099880.1 hypothetical protein BX664DRAFT_368747 [Halteromyces radiatus]
MEMNQSIVEKYIIICYWIIEGWCLLVVLLLMVVKQPFCLYELTLYESNTKCAKTPLVELRKRRCEPEMEQTLKDAPNMQAKCIIMIMSFLTMTLAFTSGPCCLADGLPHERLCLTRN